MLAQLISAWVHAVAVGRAAADPATVLALAADSWVKAVAVGSSAADPATVLAHAALPLLLLRFQRVRAALFTSGITKGLKALMTVSMPSPGICAGKMCSSEFKAGVILRRAGRSIF